MTTALPRTAPARRRSLRAVAGLAALALAVGTAATLPPAASAAPDEDSWAVYGTASATYDGVYRQSLAILGLHAAGLDVPAPAVNWLLGQQCEDGGFPAFSADPFADCAPFDSTTFTGGVDTNATAVAAQALLAVGEDEAALAAAEQLVDVQEDDGGWENFAGSGFGTDPNSTALVLTALDAAGLTPATDPVPYFAALQVGQGLPADEPGDLGGIASPYSNGAPDVLATVQTIPGVGGTNLLDVPSPTTWAATPTTYPTAPAASGANVAGWAATWLAAQLDADEVTTNNLAWSVLAFATTATARNQAEAAYAELRAGALGFGTSPAALGQAAIAAKAIGATTDATDFGELIEQTLATPPVASYRLSSSSIWSSQSVTLTRTKLFGDLPSTGVTQRVFWGDGTVTTAGAATTRFTHKYTTTSSISRTIAVVVTDELASGRGATVGTVKVTRDKVRPKVALTRPSNAAKVANWRTVKGVSSDTGLGVAKVTVSLVQRRGDGRWYGYNGSSWVRKSSLTWARKAAKPIAVAPVHSGAWKLVVKGLAKGELRVTVSARDKAGNTSATTTSTAKLTRS